MKKLLAILLCVVMLSAVLCACEETVEGPVGTLPTQALVDTYFEEADFLLQPTSVIRGIVSSGYDKASVDGEYNELCYRYTIPGDAAAALQTYVARLQADGLRLESKSDVEYMVYQNDAQVATVALSGDQLNVSILTPVQ